MADAQLRARSIAAAMQRWRPELLDIRAAIGHQSLQRRQAAVERLMAIDDVEAIEPIEEVLCGHSEKTALLAVDSLAGMDDGRASLALARQSVFSPWEEVRYSRCTETRRPRLAYLRAGDARLDGFADPVPGRAVSCSDRTAGLPPRLWP